MTKENSINDYTEESLDDLCEECKKSDESVAHNLILTGFKICKSCRVSKTIFPISVTLLIGKESILLITKDTDNIANIKKDKNIIPKDLKFDFNCSTSLVEIIRDAKIHSWVRNIIGITIVGVIAKNLSRPGACAKPTAISIFLNGTLESFSGKSLTPITNIKRAQTNQVKIAVIADKPIDVL